MGGSICVEVVAYEDQVELAALGGTADLLNRGEILKTVPRARIAPAGNMAAGAQDEQAEMHLSFHRVMSKTGFCVRGSRSVRRSSGSPPMRRRSRTRPARSRSATRLERSPSLVRHKRRAFR